MGVEKTLNPSDADSSRCSAFDVGCSVFTFHP